jgi:DUF1009 family protein
MNKLAIIAGKGVLPQMLIEKCTQDSVPFVIIGINGQTPFDIAEKASLENSASVSRAVARFFSFGEIGKIKRYLKSQAVGDIVFAGGVSRPNIKNLKLDATTFMLYLKYLLTPNKGDDALFRIISKYLIKAGFNIKGVDEILPEILANKGRAGSVAVPSVEARNIRRCFSMAKEIGKLDIGQAIIIENGYILGVEAAEGTDALIKRCCELRRNKHSPENILIKVRKPGQLRQIDLPSIGVQTVKNCHENGVKGIVVEAGSSLILNKTEVLAIADRLGIFILGL